MPPRSARPARRPAPIVNKERAAAPPWLRPVVLALAAFLLLGWFSTESADSDTWWHLKTGQYIWQNHALPVPDPFSYTTYLGKPAYPGEDATRYFNLTHEWLAQVIFYLTYAAAGFPGLILLRAAMMTAFCGIAGLVAFHRSRGFYRALAAAFATALIAKTFTVDRPYHFTFLLLAATLAILERRRAPWSRLWLLPGIFLVWANCHGGFFLGWVVLGAYCAEALYLRWRGRPLADERRLWLVSAASILISGLNPNGFQAIAVLTAYRSSPLQSTLFEWQRPVFWPPSALASMLAIVLIATAAVLLWARRRTRAVDWLLFGAFGAAAIMAYRNMNLAGLAGPILIASYLPSWKRALPVVAEFLVAGLLLAGTGAAIARGSAFQLRAADWKYPSGAADFLLAHHVSAPMFNTYEKGGYLLWRLWPQERVFIDGRALNESVFQDYRRIVAYASSTGGKSGRELLDRYGIQVIVMNSFERNAGDPYLLAAILADPAQTEWKLVFQDAQAVIFMRHPPPGVEPLRSFDALTSLESQCEVTIQRDPARPRCAHGIAHLFARIGDKARARRWMGIYLDRRVDHNPADDALYRLLVNGQR